jgi:hypothetical protein
VCAKKCSPHAVISYTFLVLTQVNNTQRFLKSFWKLAKMGPKTTIRNFIFDLALSKKRFLAQAQNALAQNFCRKNFEIMT